MINPKDFLPDLETDLSTDQITDSVEIYRDKWGIPHIVAKNEHDLFNKPSQLFRATYEPNGYVDILKTSFLLQNINKKLIC